jgi:hypothetical protein
MGRKNGNALRGGNAPRRAVTGTGESMREAWSRIVSAVTGSAWESVAQSAGMLADQSGHAHGSEPWAREAVTTYRALTA